MGVYDYDRNMDELCCDECGEPFAIDANGIANHLDDDGNIDYDADADHVPYTSEG